jgi:hypothetical protein
VKARAGVSAGVRASAACDADAEGCAATVARKRGCVFRSASHICVSCSATGGIVPNALHGLTVAVFMQSNRMPAVREQLSY